jgi:DNA gyrase inhibitor GyrI
MRSDKQISHIKPIKISFYWDPPKNTPPGVSRMMKAGRVRLFRDERASSGTPQRFFFVAYNQNHLRRITYE